MTEKTSDGAVTLDLREYNGFGQLLRAERDAVQARYRYRPDNLRHSKTVGNPFRSEKSETIHLWDGQNLVMELNGGTGRTKARYYRGISLLCQQVDDNMFYYIHNAHGDVVQQVAQDGTALAKYEYDAFGNRRRKPNAGM